jgi:hypothetical protein
MSKYVPTASFATTRAGLLCHVGRRSTTLSAMTADRLGQWLHAVCRQAGLVAQCGYFAGGGEALDHCCYSRATVNCWRYMQQMGACRYCSHVDDLTYYISRPVCELQQGETRSKAIGVGGMGRVEQKSMMIQSPVNYNQSMHGQRWASANHADEAIIGGSQLGLEEK